MLEITPKSSREVLLVDDDSDTQQMFRSALKRSPMSLMTASTFAQALEVLATHQPSLIILDIMLPEGHDGYKLLRMIRQQYGLTCPVIATSAYYDHDMQIRILEDGFSGFLPKPLVVEELSAYLQQFVQ